MIIDIFFLSLSFFLRSPDPVYDSMYILTYRNI